MRRNLKTAVIIVRTMSKDLRGNPHAIVAITVGADTAVIDVTNAPDRAAALGGAAAAGTTKITFQ